MKAGDVIDNVALAVFYGVIAITIVTCVVLAIR